VSTLGRFTSSQTYRKLGKSVSCRFSPTSRHGSALTRSTRNRSSQPTIRTIAGYNVYVVEDCCGATSPGAQEAALSRMVQAGAVRLTTIGALLEF
jgi:hypothetical protein